MGVEEIVVMQDLGQFKVSRGLRLRRQGLVRVKSGYMLSLSKTLRCSIWRLYVHYLMRLWMPMFCLIRDLLFFCPHV